MDQVPSVNPIPPSTSSLISSIATSSSNPNPSPVQQSIPPQETTPPAADPPQSARLSVEQEYAGFGRRFLASLIDLVVILGAGIVIGMISAFAGVVLQATTKSSILTHEFRTSLKNTSEVARRSLDSSDGEGIIC